MSRPLSRDERVVDGWVNSIGLAAGVVGFAILICVAAPESGFVLKASLSVYGGALVAMLGEVSSCEPGVIEPGAPQLHAGKAHTAEIG